VLTTIALCLWCLGFGYFVREWTFFESWRHRARAIVAALLWPIFLIILLLQAPPEEEEPWHPPPPPAPREKLPQEGLFPDDEW
jgi:hypothetical protein